MQNECKVYMESYLASNGSRFMGTWIIFQKLTLGGIPNTLPGDHGTPNAHNHRIIPILSCVDTHMNRNSLK